MALPHSLVVTGAAVALGLFLSSCGDEPPPAAKVAKAAAAPATMTPPWPPIRERSGKGQAGETVDNGGAARLTARNYYLVFDASGSMNESKCGDGQRKIDVARQAVRAFVRQLPKDANLGLTTFDGSGVRERVPLVAMDSALPRVEGVVQGLHPGGGTPLLGAIRVAHRALAAQGERQLGYGEYHLVVITDGEFMPDAENPAPEVERILVSSPIVLNTIGFCVGEQHSLNQPGRTIYRAANNANELTQGLADVLAEAPSFDVAKFK